MAQTEKRPPEDSGLALGEKFFPYSSSSSLFDTWLGWFEAGGAATGYIHRSGDIWRPGEKGLGFRTLSWNKARGAMRVAWCVRPSESLTEYSGPSSLAEALQIIIDLSSVPKSDLERSVMADIEKALSVAKTHGFDSVGGTYPIGELKRVAALELILRTLAQDLRALGEDNTADEKTVRLRFLDMADRLVAELPESSP